MSQMPATQDIQQQLHASSVTNYFNAMQQRDASILENLKVCKEAVLEAAQLYSDEHDDEKLKKLREQLLELVDTEAQIHAHKAALVEVARDYQPSLQRTDFAQLMQQHMQGAAINAHPERDEDVQEFDNIAGTAPGAAPEDEGLDSDEELVVVGAAEKNDKCPYTMKSLIDLQEPVEDQQGFVYEAAAIRQAILHGRVGSVVCPMPGVSHRVSLNSLKPCRRILRLQKQKQKGTQAGGPTQQHPGGGAHGRVLDI